MSSSRPEDAVAIVTGASSGIGRATALRLANDGFTVLAVGRDKARLALTAERSERLEPHVADLGEARACDRAIAAANRLGTPVVIVHSAGRGGYLDRPIWDLDAASWRATMSINVDAAYHLLHAVSRHMKEAGWGRAVIVGSTAGDVPAPAQAAYSASKAGVMGLVRSVGFDLAAIGATCNAVLPGWVSGSLMADEDAREEATRRRLSPEAVWAERASSYPTGRVVSPEEVADVIAFLVSHDGRAVNGQGIAVTHGSAW